jgi:2-isopropylmalate synthase
MGASRDTSLEEVEREELIVDYNRFPDARPKNLPEEVYIWDETLRDGEQTPGVFLTIDEKIELAKMMDDIGVAIIAVGFPAVSKSEREVVKRISNEGLNASVAAPARAIRSDIDACIECEADQIPLFIATSDLHMKYKLRMDRGEVIERIIDSVQYAKDHGIIIDFITEDSTRTESSFLIKSYKSAIEAGADKICICDTVGFIRPLSMKYLVDKVREEIWKLKKIPIAVHCHDDFGLATANTLAAIEEGVTFPHTCVNGYGERAGNAPLEEVVVALERLYNIKTHIKMEKLYELSSLTEKYFMIPIPANKAIVGECAFAHESGIHVHGEMKHPFTYECVSPESVGRDRSFLIGKFSGKHTIRKRLEEENIKASEEEISEIVERVKESCTCKKKREMAEKFEFFREGMKEIRMGMDKEELLEIIQNVCGT